MKNIALVALLFSVGFLAFKFTVSDPAVSFLKSLDQSQLEKTQLPFDDMSRTNWHFLPGAMWPRAGVQLNELNPDQKALCFELLESHLSKSNSPGVSI